MFSYRNRLEGRFGFFPSNDEIAEFFEGLAFLQDRQNAKLFKRILVAMLQSTVYIALHLCFARNVKIAKHSAERNASMNERNCSLYLLALRKIQISQSIHKVVRLAYFIWANTHTGNCWNGIDSLMGNNMIEKFSVLLWVEAGIRDKPANVREERTRSDDWFSINTLLLSFGMLSYDWLSFVHNVRCTIQFEQNKYNFCAFIIKQWTKQANGCMCDVRDVIIWSNAISKRFNFSAPRLIIVGMS